MAEKGMREYEVKYPRQARELLEIMALALRGAPLSTRLALCERSSKLAQGHFSDELSLRLTEAELQLEAKRPRRALDLCLEIRPSLERQQSEYSLFRAELIAALACRQVGQNDSGAAARANAALARFQKRFDSSGWKRFRTRPDFLYWENKLLQIR